MDSPSHSRLTNDPGFSAAYELVDELGRGSFGHVYRARQRSTGQDVAIKVLQRLGDSRADSEDRQIRRFQQELRLCADLFHPNIVRLIDSGEAADGMLYAVFEHVPGTTLKEVLAAEGRLELREAAHLMSQVLDALASAHARGIVHRDLTPANIMITSTGIRRNALVLDFGLGGFARDFVGRQESRITRTQEMLGTPCYAAPEQLRGEHTSPGSDFYSWGLVLLECLTGELPIQGASAQEVIHKQLGSDPVSIPRWLRSQAVGQMIAEVTAKRAERRLTDARRALEALGEISSAEARAASSSLPVPSADRARRQLTVLCCRLSVASSADRDLDVEEVDHVIQTRFDALAAAASDAGGSIAAVLADRVFVVHGYPRAHEGDARRAGRTALAVVEAIARGNTKAEAAADPRCDVHVGIHTGLVLLRAAAESPAARSLELTGLTPQIASRLSDLAGPGEVLVSADTGQLVERYFDAQPAGDRHLVDQSRPMPTFRITAARPRAEEERSATRMLRSPLVGRVREIDRLVEEWRGAVAGNPGMVLVTGEAGIGKSRLLRELRQRVDTDAWAVWECTEESRTAPLRPVVDHLASLDEPIDALLERLDIDTPEYRPLLAALLAGPAADPDPSTAVLTAERQKELTLEAILTLVLRQAERRPLVLAVENVHWADPTTLELLMLLAVELRAIRAGGGYAVPRLYVVLTTRPEGIPPWAGDHLAFLPLQRLAKHEVEEMIRANLPDPASPTATLVEAVMERSEGIPLFVEELARLVSETQRRAASSSRSGVQRLDAEVSTSLRDLLTARLDTVSPTARETAQLAAVLGREFGYDVLQAVSPRAGVLLRDDVDELTRSGLVFPRRAGGGQRFLFRHALLRDAAYDALTRPVREGLHRRVAEVLRREFADFATRRPEILALHHEQGGEPSAAADLWLLAGQRSYQAAAYGEALSQLERGLGAARSLDDSPGNRSREVDLLVAYGTSLLSTRGWGDPEVEETFSRALEKAESLGGGPPLMVLYGLWGVLIIRSNRAALEAFLPRIEALAESTTDRGMKHFCHSILGVAATWRGDFPESCALFERALESYDEASFYTSYDSGIYTYSMYSCGSWELGFAERAVAFREQAFALARRRGDPYSLAVALAFAGVLANNLCEGDAEMSYGEQLMSLSTEQRLHAFWPAGACSYGAGLVHKGALEEGLRFIRDGLDRYRAFGMMGSYSDHQIYLAEACLALDRVEDAAAAIDESFELCDTLYARWHMPELWRVRGEIAIRRGDPVAAEDAFRRGGALAAERGCLFYELRSATAVARLLDGTSRRDEARATLASIRERFTEGFETRDLRAAAELLSAP